MPGLKAHSAESFKAPPIFHAVAKALLDYVASLHSLWGFEPDTSSEDALDRIAAFPSVEDATTRTTRSGDRKSLDGLKEFIDLAFDGDCDVLSGEPLVPLNVSYRFTVFLDGEGDVVCGPCATISSADGFEQGVNLAYPGVVNSVLGCVERLGADGVGFLCKLVCLFCDAVSFYSTCGSGFGEFVSNFAVVISALRDAYTNDSGKAPDDTDSGADDVHSSNICGDFGGEVVA
jgi:hypothetical protein